MGRAVPIKNNIGTALRPNKVYTIWVHGTLRVRAQEFIFFFFFGGGGLGLRNLGARDLSA